MCELAGGEGEGNIRYGATTGSMSARSPALAAGSRGRWSSSAARPRETLGWRWKWGGIPWAHGGSALLQRPIDIALSARLAQNVVPDVLIAEAGH